MATEMRLELVQVPVSDIDRAKAFYVEKVGFNDDHDHQVSATRSASSSSPLPGRPARSP